ncbi:MAG: hypothetical protein DMG77_11130 [Acidobacteria bacterium]|nr:MAG: hypothetical protein DMG77_11130 [Acidobacteriota bacterium]
MKAFREFGLLVIVAHWGVVVWHLLLVAKVLPSFTTQQITLVIGSLTLAHLVVFLAWWIRPNRFGGLLLLVFLTVALAAGIYEHFLSSGPNNVFRIAPGQWTTAFQASVAMLPPLELSGIWLGIRTLRH